MFSGASKEIFQRATELRNRETHAEDILWGYLKTKPLGFKFRRQHPYANYILDFYCHQLKIVIEVDGSIHNEEEVIKRDIERQTVLEENGLQMVRFKNEEVERKLESVILKIEARLNEKKDSTVNDPQR
jgi:cyclase